MSEEARIKEPSMIKSRFEKLETVVPIPEFRNMRIMMMPIVFGDPESVLQVLVPTMDALARAKPEHVGKVVYLTVDQKLIVPGLTHRRSGLHVDGYNKTADSLTAGGWGGGGGSWGGGRTGDDWQDGNGMLLISDAPGCMAWNQDFIGEPEIEGDCEHLREQCCGGEILEPKVLYWLSPGCVHESLPMTEFTRRTLIRLSLPSTCDWYEGYTENPTGVQPVGRVRPYREFMAF